MSCQQSQSSDQMNAQAFPSLEQASWRPGIPCVLGAACVKRSFAGSRGSKIAISGPLRTQAITRLPSASSPEPRATEPCEPRTKGLWSSASVHWRVSRAQDRDAEANSVLAIWPACFGFGQGLSGVCNCDGTWATDAATRADGSRRQFAFLLAVDEQSSRWNQGGPRPTAEPWSNPEGAWGPAAKWSNVPRGPVLDATNCNVTVTRLLFPCSSSSLRAAQVRTLEPWDMLTWELCRLLGCATHAARTRAATAICQCQFDRCQSDSDLASPSPGQLLPDLSESAHVHPGVPRYICIGIWH